MQARHAMQVVVLVSNRATNEAKPPFHHNTSKRLAAHQYQMRIGQQANNRQTCCAPRLCKATQDPTVQVIGKDALSATPGKDGTTHSYVQSTQPEITQPFRSGERYDYIWRT